MSIINKPAKKLKRFSHQCEFQKFQTSKSDANKTFL